MEHLSVAVWSAYYKVGKFTSPSKGVQAQANEYLMQLLENGTIVDVVRLGKKED